MAKDISEITRTPAQAPFTAAGQTKNLDEWLAAITNRVEFVANHAALEVIVPTSGAPTRYCSGHTTAGDGGEGVWRWVAGNSDTANGGTILGSDAAGRWKRAFSGPVNVKWFGAVGDDSTNNKTAIESAAVVAGAASYVYFPAGTYRAGTYSETIDLSSCSGIVGDGPASILKFFASFDSVDNILIEQLKFVDRASNLLPTSGISLDDCDNAVVQYCDFDMADITAYSSAKWAKNLKIQNNRFYGDGTSYTWSYDVANNKNFGDDGAGNMNIKDIAYVSGNDFKITFDTADADLNIRIPIGRRVEISGTSPHNGRRLVTAVDNTGPNKSITVTTDGTSASDNETGSSRVITLEGAFNFVELQGIDTAALTDNIVTGIMPYRFLKTTQVNNTYYCKNVSFERNQVNVAFPSSKQFWDGYANSKDCKLSDNRISMTGDCTTIFENKSNNETGAFGPFTISNIAWQSGTTVRYNFSGSPDLSSVEVGDLFVVGPCRYDEHNGDFTVTAVSDGSDYIEVNNALVTDATLDVTGDPYAKANVFADDSSAGWRQGNTIVSGNVANGEFNKFVSIHGPWGTKAESEFYRTSVVVAGNNIVCQRSAEDSDPQALDFRGITSVSITGNHIDFPNHTDSGTDRNYECVECGSSEDVSITGNVFSWGKISASSTSGLAGSYTKRTKRFTASGNVLKHVTRYGAIVAFNVSGGRWSVTDNHAFTDNNFATAQFMRMSGSMDRLSVVNNTMEGVSGGLYWAGQTITELVERDNSWQPLQATAANLGDIANAINTAVKYFGKEVYDTTNDQWVYATGSAAGDKWSGPTDITPS